MFGEAIKPIDGKFFSRYGKQISCIPQPIKHKKDLELQEAANNSSVLMKQHSDNKVKKKKNEFSVQPFTKILPRNNLAIQNQTNLFGRYQPKYDMVDRNVQSFKFVSKMQQKVKQIIQSQTDAIIQLNHQVKGIIPLDKQIPRKSFVTKNLSEKRFDYIQLPEICTKVTRTKNVIFGNSERDDQFLRSNLTGLYYVKKYSQIEKRNDLNIVSFQKVDICLQLFQSKLEDRVKDRQNILMMSLSMRNLIIKKVNLHNKLLSIQIGNVNFERMLSRKVHQQSESCTQLNQFIDKNDLNQSECIHLRKKLEGSISKDYSTRKI